MDSLNKKKILLSGQLLSSLTEMSEDYLKGKAAVLAVIGIISPYSAPGYARATYYESGSLKSNKKIFNLYFKRLRSIYLFIPVFIVYLIVMIFAALKFKKKFDIFLGISVFSAFIGIILKKLRAVRKVIFYSIDYFPIQHKSLFEDFMCKCFFKLDRFCVENCDLTWHINPKISEARRLFSGLDREKYVSINVPLGYGEDILTIKPINEIERYTIGFVGTLNPNQGLDLAIEAFPQIMNKFPKSRFEIIGDGIYADQLKKKAGLVSDCGKITFYGFISDRKKVSEILSKCAIAVALWTMDKDNNILYADPGKPKHYASCGLPVIITRTNAIAEEIERRGAGIAINYDKQEYVNAVEKLFTDDILLSRCKKNAFNFALDYTYNKIYDKAWGDSLRSLYGSREG